MGEPGFNKGIPSVCVVEVCKGREFPFTFQTKRMSSERGWTVDGFRTPCISSDTAETEPLNLWGFNDILEGMGSKERILFFLHRVISAPKFAYRYTKWPRIISYV